MNENNSCEEKCQGLKDAERDIQEIKLMVLQSSKTIEDMNATFQTLRDAEGFFNTVDRVGVWAKKMGIFALAIGGIVWGFDRLNEVLRVIFLK